MSDPRPAPAPAERPEPGSDGTVVVARDLHRTFRGSEAREIRVLRGLDLELRAGESLAIVGPSGSGKSTLLHLLGGLDRPTSGSVELYGRALEAMDDDALADHRNRIVGFVFQFHHLLRDFTARENVMIPQLVGGVPRDRARRRAEELLAQVELSDRAGHRPSRLSGGEQQRVAVARALANEPPLVLADEPSGNLDFEASARLHDMLFELVDRHGTAMVVVTHNQQLAGRADRVLQLDEGRLRDVTAEVGR